jgi:hypothetical protein
VQTVPYKANFGNSFLMTSTGNVGIGLTDPDSRLDINAGVTAITAGPAVRISKGGSPVGLIRYDTLVIEANDVPTIRLGENDGTVSTIMSGDSNLRINSTHPIKFFTDGTTTGEGHNGQGGTFAMIIDNSQNVGIGTTSPGAALEIANEDLNVDNTILNIGNAIVAPNTRDSWIKMFASQNTSDKTFAIGNAYGKFVVNYLGTRATNPLSAGSKIFTVDGPNGNVGIGTYTPNAKLDVQGTQGQLFSVTDDLSGDIFSVADISGVPIMNVNSDGTSYFDGDVGIGVENPSYKLDVWGDGIALGSAAFAKYDSSNDLFLVGDWDGAGADMAIYDGNSSEVVRIKSDKVGIGEVNPSYSLDVSGTIRATGDVIAYSDKRVKENIQTIDNSLEKVIKLRGVEFNKIGEDKKSIGVIAQEIEKILPEVVREDDKGMKSVAYGNITGILIEAIKELKAEIEELKKQIKDGNNL